MNIINSREFCDGEYPYEERMNKKQYAEQKTLLQIELLKVQRWAKESDQKILALFEGRDAAGKGGTIKRFMEHLNPRGARVVALEKPTEREKNQWYLQRYVQHLPTAGEIVFFDRSWYNRAGVERVMGFCTEEQVDRFMRQCPDFERMLVNSGAILFKFWFTVHKDEQARRFESRETDPLKRWKLSPIDIASRSLWDEYTEAREDMFIHTHTEKNPWTLIKSDDKRRARINALRLFLNRIDYPDKDVDLVSEIDPRIVGMPPFAANTENNCA